MTATVSLLDTCIISGYAKDKDGYARYYSGGKGKTERHHRVVYALHNKLTLQDIKNKVIRHMCDNPACINPIHLLSGTHAENAVDKMKRGRAVTGNPKVLTEAQVTEIRNTSASVTALATKYKVSRATISRVLFRERGYLK